MSSERIFTEKHLPGGLRVATNPSNTEEENQDLEELFREMADAASNREEIYEAMLLQEEQILEAKERLKSYAHGMNSGEIDDNVQKKSNTENMNDITREEFNAKLETIETKMDSRVEAVSSKIDAFVAVQVERDKRMEATLHQIFTNHAEIKSSIGSMKTAMIVTAVSTVLAIVIGIAGFNAMLTSNMVASFQMGRSEQAYHKTTDQSTSPAPAPSLQK